MKICLLPVHNLSYSRTKVMIRDNNHNLIPDNYNLTSNNREIMPNYQSFSYTNRTPDPVMSLDEISSQEERKLMNEHSEYDSDTTIGSRTILSRSTSLESTLNRISLDQGQFVPVKSSNQHKRPLESPINRNSTSTPIKRAKTITGMKPLTSEMVKNDFHIVDIESDDEKAEFLTTIQGNNIYTAVLKEILKAADISKINFEDSFNDRGKYRYICSNVETRDWLIAIIPTITPWANAKIKPVYQGAPPTLVKYTINMKLPYLDPGDIFTLMAAQNPNLDTTNWKCVHRSKADSNGKQIWTIGVDENSIEALQNIDFKPHAGSGRIKLYPKK